MERETNQDTEENLDETGLERIGISYRLQEVINLKKLGEPLLPDLSSIIANHEDVKTSLRFQSGMFPHSHAQLGIDLRGDYDKLKIYLIELLNEYGLPDTISPSASIFNLDRKDLFPTKRGYRLVKLMLEDRGYFLAGGYRDGEKRIKKSTNWFSDMMSKI